jgi:hypothetical protein
MPQAGLQSEINVESSPTIPNSMVTKPHVWSWTWFIVALLVIIGFHVRVFGRAVPPIARFP